MAQSGRPGRRDPICQTDSGKRKIAAVRSQKKVWLKMVAVKLGQWQKATFLAMAEIVIILSSLRFAPVAQMETVEFLKYPSVQHNFAG